MSEKVKCNHCGELKAPDEFGHSLYYAKVCKECQNKHGLCPDCGGPIAVSGDKPFACTGWHYSANQNPIEVKLANEAIATPILPFYVLNPPRKTVTCPKCGHEFES